MMREKFFLAVVLLFSISLGTQSFAQMEINSETTKKEKKKKKEKKEWKKDDATSVFIQTNWSYTTRKLIENDGLHGQPLGERANETASNAWSFGLGLKNKLHRYISWEGGISYMTNKEKYSYEMGDSSYMYTTKYSYISMPLKLYFEYGDKVKLVVGGGVVPQMFIGYRQDREWVTSGGSRESEKFKTKNGYSPFVLSAVANIGIQARLGERLSMMLIPEYRIQLTSSDDDNSSYKHFGRSLGVNVGLMFDF